MPRPNPTPRPDRPQVAVQVARGTGPAGTPASPVPAMVPGRHRTPDPGGEPAGPPRATSSRPGAPSRHAVPTPALTTPAGPARRGVAEASARVDRVRAPIPRPAPASPAAAPRPRRPEPEPAPRTRRPPRDVPTDDEAVTELVAGTDRRGRPGAPEGPGTGRAPALVGLVLGVLALFGAVVVAAGPPVLGRVGSSPLTLGVLVAAGLLATACAGAGAGRHRSGRALAVTGMVVGLAAVAAAGLSLLAL